MNKIKKYLAIALVAVVLLFTLVGCGEGNIENLTDEAGSFSNIAKTKSLTDELLLAWSPANLDEEFYVEVTRGFEAYCEEKKYEALVADPKNNKEEQYSEFENWVAMGVDGIAASPVDAARLNGAVVKAKDAGIASVGFYDAIPLANRNYVLDEYACGVLIGENAVRWIEEKVTGPANVVIIGNDADEGMRQRREGIDSALAGISPVRVVSRISVTSVIEAKKSAIEIMSKYNYINVVICVSDAYAFAALEAVKELKIKKDNYYIGGAGYTSKMVEEMNETGSKLRSTVNFDPYQAGRMIAQMLAQADVKDYFGKTDDMSMKSYWQNLLGWE
jgi:ribose transport system substrate-binding protein